MCFVSGSGYPSGHEHKKTRSAFYSGGFIGCHLYHLCVHIEMFSYVCSLGEFSTQVSVCGGS